jgi:hypothetical protein
MVKRPLKTSPLRVFTQAGPTADDCTRLRAVHCQVASPAHGAFTRRCSSRQGVGPLVANRPEDGFCDENEVAKTLEIQHSCNPV